MNKYKKNSGCIMKGILEKYKKRLISIDGRNRSLKSNRIINTKAFDLSLLYHKNSEIQNILPKIINRQDSIIHLFNSKNKEDETIKALDNNIKSLKREVDNKLKETGIYNLYVGYPFVEGCLGDGTFIRCPLFLFPVEIIKSGFDWNLKNINSSQNILHNKVFIKGYEHYNGIKLNINGGSFDNLLDFNGDIIKNVLDYYKELGIDIQDTGVRDDIETFIPYTKKETPVYKNNELIFKNHCVLGQFPISNSIYEDYEELENKENLTSDALRKLIVTTDEKQECNTLYKKPLYLNELDYSQNKVVEETHKQNNLVIYGAAGTGKSQVIVNIIASHIAKGKRVLMVSQKKSALDVVYNRLNVIQDKICYITDIFKGKKEFYQKVLNIRNKVNYQASQEIDALEIEIQKNEKELENALSCINNEMILDLYLKEIYLITDRIENVKDPRFRFYKEFIQDRAGDTHYDSILNLYKNKNFETLKNNIKNIKNKYLFPYLQYKKNLIDNPCFEYIKDDFNLIKKNEFINNKDKILNTLNSSNVELTTYSNTKSYEGFKDVYYNLKDNKHRMKIIFTRAYYGLLKGSLKGIKWYKLLNFILKAVINCKKDYNTYKNNYKNLTDVVNIYNTIFDNKYSLEVCMDGMDKEVFNIFKTMEHAGNMHEAYKKFKSLFDWDAGVVEDDIKHILEICYKCDVDEFEFNVDNFIDIFLNHHIEAIERKYKVSNGEQTNFIIQDLKMLKDKKNRLTTNFILGAENNNEYSKNFTYQAGKQRQLWSIRDFITNFKDEVFNRFPCWLLNQENVSNIFPLEENLFDVIVFDEASQMFIEEAIPSIYRGKVIIIAGDDKQLQPNKVGKIKEEIDDEEEMIASVEQESLLDIAKINYPSIHLNYHYRSKYNELIDFSNHSFYDCKLEVCPSLKINHAPIEVIKIDGKWIKRQNEAEAERIADLVYKILKERENDETLGIITFNSSQRDLVIDKLEDMALVDIGFKKLYEKELIKIKDNEDKSIFIKNIENVQGDERDIIIFSVGYAPDGEGMMYNRFGTFNQDGGINRLNVAITRAKQKIYIVTSIYPNQLQIKNENLAPRLLKKYLQYCFAISNNDTKLSNVILNDISGFDIVDVKKDDIVKTMSEDILNHLDKDKYCIFSGLGSSKSEIDLAIYDKQKQEYVLGIDFCLNTNKNNSILEQYYYKSMFFTSNGWNIINIHPRDWYINKDEEINKILNKIK